MSQSSQQLQNSIQPQLNHPLCHRQHNFMPLDKICMRPECFRKNLICTFCEQQEHNTIHHYVQTVQHFKNLTIKRLSRENVNFTKKIQSLLQCNQKADDNIQQKIYSMKVLMKKIRKKLQKASKNQFKDVVKIYREDSYLRQYDSLNQGITQEKISNICYKLNVLNRLQYYQNKDNVKREEKNYIIAIDLAIKQLEQINKNFNELKYVQKQKQDKIVIPPKRYKRYDQNNRMAMQIQDNRKKERTRNSQPIIGRKAQKRRQTRSSSRRNRFEFQSKLKKVRYESQLQTDNLKSFRQRSREKKPRKQRIKQQVPIIRFPPQSPMYQYQHSPEPLIVDDECIIIDSVKRPRKNPQTMTDQQLQDWFKEYYQADQIYSVVLSHRIQGKVQQFYLYCLGSFKWFTQKFLQDSDQRPQIQSYMNAWNKFYGSM